MIRSNNEWERLREVVVGTAENANNPRLEKDLHCINYADIDDVKIQRGYYPKVVVEETQEDLYIFQETLEDLDIKVKRVIPQNNKKNYSNPFWETDGYYNYCPRDSVTVIGDTTALLLCCRR